MVKRDYDDDLEKWTGDKEGAEDFDDAAIAEALSKFGKLGEHLYLQNAPPMNVGTFEEYCNLVCLRYPECSQSQLIACSSRSRAQGGSRTSYRHQGECGRRRAVGLWPLAVLVPGSHANQPGSRV